jgi:YgiT-type zinc finger domain-containing protein
MKCTICKQGTARAGHCTVTLERLGTVVVIRGVPAMVCEQCGEYYLDEATAEKVLVLGQEAAARRTEVEVTRWAA